MDKFECGSCRYSLATGNPNQVFCRRYPPYVIPRTDGTLGTEFPQMMMTGWCGEFQSQTALTAMTGWGKRQQ